MTDPATQCTETPVRDHVARFWRHLETETVRILVNLRRVVGHGAPDGPVEYWDGASFSDDVAKALVAERRGLDWRKMDQEACCNNLYEIGGALRRMGKYGLAKRAEKVADALYPGEVKPLPIVPRTISG